MQWYAKYRRRNFILPSSQPTLWRDHALVLPVMLHEKQVAQVAVLMEIRRPTRMMMTHLWKNFKNKKWKDQLLLHFRSEENFHVSNIPVLHADRANQNMLRNIRKIP